MIKINRPTLLLDKQKCLSNINFMVNKAATKGLVLRPHFKSHQSHTIGRWYREAGVEKITVSSVVMAEYFMLDGWEDIAIAFPFNIHEINETNRLASRIKLHLTVCSENTANFLAKNITSPVGVYIKIDAGYKRTGLQSDNTREIDDILNVIKSSVNLNFTGFMVHSGETSKARSFEEVEKVHIDAQKKLAALKRRYKSSWPRMIISTGDTPTAMMMEDFKGIDEIRPGKFVFFDLTQMHVGACDPSQISIAMACPVISKHPERRELVIYGGAIHFSKEQLILPDGKAVYGQIVELTPNGWTDPLEDVYLADLSQEHGIIRPNKEFFEKTEPGKILGILPARACLSVNLMQGPVTLENEKIDHFATVKKEYGA